MTRFRSAIYEGKVRHRRFEPIEREFEYRIFMAYLDLDELPRLMKVHPLWSTRRRSPARFRRADYLGPADVPLKQAVVDLVESRTGTRPEGPVRMLTHLRYWGRIENPVTFYYCFNRLGDEVETVVAEVTNTPWGDRHTYVIDGHEHEGIVSSRTAKAMHVSPLMSMNHEYDLRFGLPGEHLPVHIESSRDGRKFFDATLKMRRTPITKRSLGRLLVTYPPMSLKVTAGIHWQAALTWLRGVKYQPRPVEDDLRSDAEPAKMCPMHGVRPETSQPDLERVN